MIIIIIILWDSEIQTDNLISAGLPDLVIVNNSKTKKDLSNSGLRGPQIINKRNRKERYISRPWQRTKKTIAHEGDGDINSNKLSLNKPQSFTKWT